MVPMYNLYHMDDLTISHRDLSVIRDITTLINDTFKTKNQSLSVTEGKVYDYVGIRINYSKKDCVTFTMYDYLEDILKETNERGDMNGTAATPVLDNLFIIDESSPKLDNEKSEYFHHVTARFLLLRKDPDLTFKSPLHTYVPE